MGRVGGEAVTVVLTKPAHAPTTGERIARAAGVAWRWTCSTVANPPDIWRKEQPPLRALLEYSLHGEYTTAGPGLLRSAHLVFTCLLSIPLTGFAYVVMWLAQRPARFVLGVPALMVIDAAASTLPLVGWLAPDVLNPFAWF